MYSIIPVSGPEDKKKSKPASSNSLYIYDYYYEENEFRPYEMEKIVPHKEFPIELLSKVPPA